MSDKPHLALSAQQVKNFLQSSDERACALTYIFNKIFPLYGIDNFARVHMTLAQLAHESIMFTDFEENLSYSAGALARTWPLRFAKNPNAKVKIPNAKATAIEHKPQVIANDVYGGRLGNDKINDGWNLRGSGAIQLTGKDNISAYAKYKGFTNVYDTAKLMRESDEYAIDSGCWYVAVYKDLLPEMDREHLEHVTSGINGALIGIDDRRRLWERAKKYITAI